MPALTLGGPSPEAVVTTLPGKPSLSLADARTGWTACAPSFGSRPANPASHRQQDPGSDFRLPSHVSNRVATLIQDGALRRACTALTQEPPVQPTPSVIDELRGLHPVPRPQDSALLSCLRTIGPAAAPCVSPDMIRKAVSDFSPHLELVPRGSARPPPTSHVFLPLLALSSSVCCAEVVQLHTLGARPRLCLVFDFTTHAPGSCDQLLSLLARSFSFLQGHVPPTVVPWLCLTHGEEAFRCPQAHRGR